MSNSQQKILIEESLSRIPEVQLLYLFGNMATGIANSHSDVDVAFLSDVIITNVDRWHIQQEISRALNTQLDLVDLSTTSDIMNMQIISQGRLLYHDEFYSIDNFENRIFYKYIDLKELNRAIYQDIAKRGAIYE